MHMTRTGSLSENLDQSCQYAGIEASAGEIWQKWHHPDKRNRRKLPIRNLSDKPLAGRVSSFDHLCKCDGKWQRIEKPITGRDQGD